MGEALTRDKELTLKIESQIEHLRRYRGSSNLPSLLAMAEESLGKDHIVLAILVSVLHSETEGVMNISSKFISDDVHASIVGMSADEKEISEGVLETRIAEERRPTTQEAAEMTATASAAATGGVIAVAASSTNKTVVKEGLKYSPLSPDVFLETGKVVGQNGTRLAGQVIVGVSAAFLAWDVIDLGWTVADLIRKKGSQAAKVLKDKADELDMALRETTENYSVEMMKD